MYLKILIVFVSLLVLQSLGVGAFAQTEVPRGCVLTADGEIDCSAMAPKNEDGAKGGSGEAVTTRSVIPGGEATRIFAHPRSYPPREFGAYAIVAFKSRADANDRDRYIMICRAYMSAVPDSSRSDLPKVKQLATIWPLEDEAAHAEVARSISDADACELAVDDYGLTTSLRAIRHARSVSQDMHEYIAQKRGPFLFAWNPGHAKGQPDALILRMDLSNVVLPAQAKRRFEFWVHEIEENPRVWQDGWQRLPIRNRIAETADRYGQVILDFVGG